MVIMGRGIYTVWKEIWNNIFYGKLAFSKKIAF